MEKGRALEAAIRYAFEQIPGVECSMQDQRNAFESEEVDLIFSNVGHEDGLARFETEFLVEAKNWSSKVGAIEICWFATKMRRRNRKTGVLVAAHGLTGKEGELSAARYQVTLALNEGQEVVVLTRTELEQAPSGERLAKLLLKKRDHLIARQDIYEAAPEDLRRRRGAFRHGREAFRKLVRGERLRRIEEAQERAPQLPRDEEARASLLRVGFDALDPILSAAAATPAEDPRGEILREALMAIAATCVAWLETLGFEDPETIQLNAALSGMDRLRLSPGSRLWRVLADYYCEELARERPEVSHDSMLFALASMLIEEIWSLDEYWPEPEEV